MNILFVSAVLPYPLHSGGQIRIYHLLKRLSRKHEITLYAFIRSQEEKKYLSELSFCKKVITVMRGNVWQPKYLWKTLTSSYPLLWSSYHNAEMLSRLAEEKDHDLIHIEPGYVWPCVPQLGMPVVIAEHNVEHEIYAGFAGKSWFSPFLRLDIAKMRYWESRVWKEAAKIIAVSEDDAGEIRRLSGKPVEVVSNGVDVPSFPFRPKKHGNALTFLFVGNFRWLENRDAAENILKNYWPVIKKQYPHATLRIVGKGAPDGEVKNIADEFHAADVLLAPIRIGGGTKFKILEAMASGLPVVTTTIGAAGFDKRALWIEDTPEALDVRAVLADSEKIHRARKSIEQAYNWDTIAEKLDRIWTSLS